MSVPVDFAENNNIFVTDSEKFYFNSEIPNDCKEDYRYRYWMETDQPNQTNPLQADWLQIMEDENTAILNEPDQSLVTFGDISNFKVDESDFMHIDIDEMKLEWPQELKPSTFQETIVNNRVSPLVLAPKILRPDSPLATLSNIALNGMLANIPPVSPPPVEQSYLLPETRLVDQFSLVKLEHPFYERMLDDEVSTEKDADVSWHESSGDEFDKKFEREEQMEEILKSYQRGGINSDDNFVYCDLCNRRWSPHCPQHGKLKHIKDMPVPMGTNGRAERTAPSFLLILASKIKGANKGVWTRKNIPKQSYFGPYEGCKVPVDHPNGEYCWKVTNVAKSDHLVDGSDSNKSNWMRFVNNARTTQEQNLEAFQFRGEIFYRTTKDIAAGQELLVWYGFKYARKLAITWKDFVMSNPPSKKDVVFSCDTCFHAYADPIKLKRHTMRKCCKRSSSPSEGCLESHILPSVAKEKSSICMEVTTGDAPITCGVCGARFRRRGKPLRDHMKEHSDQKHDCCLRCGQWFPDKSSLNDHHTAVSEARKRVPKSKPGEIKTVTGNVLCDIRSNKAQIRLNTTIVKKLPKHTKELRRKERSDTGTGTKSKNYEEDGSVSRTWRRKDGSKDVTPLSGRTIEKAVPAAERPMQEFLLCEKCGALFRRISLLLIHLETKHDVRSKEKEMFARTCPARRFKCRECGVMYRERSTLESHMKIHKEDTEEESDKTDEELKFPCSTCDMKFRAAVTLKYHMETHKDEGNTLSYDHKHTPTKKYKCKECHVRFRGRSTLDLHMKMHYDDQRLSISVPKEKFVSTKSSRPNRACPFDKTLRTKSSKDLRESTKQMVDRSSESAQFDEKSCGQKKGSTSGHSLDGSQEKQEFPKRDNQLKKLPRRDKDDSTEVVHKKTRRIMCFECLACGFIFKDRRALDTHVRKHMKEKILVCDLSSVRISV